MLRRLITSKVTVTGLSLSTCQPLGCRCLSMLQCARAGFVGLVWRIKVAEIVAMASAPIGAAFTFVTLVTGSLWGKPMWGTYWVWDARLTSELILLFLYLGIMGLYHAVEDRRNAARAAALLALVGLVNIPIIHFSVKWWNTLHQGQTVSLTGEQHIHHQHVDTDACHGLRYQVLLRHERPAAGPGHAAGAGKPQTMGPTRTGTAGHGELKNERISAYGRLRILRMDCLWNFCGGHAVVLFRTDAAAPQPGT